MSEINQERDLKHYPHFCTPYEDENGVHPMALTVATQFKIDIYGETLKQRNIFVRWQRFRDEAHFKANKPMTSNGSVLPYTKSGDEIDAKYYQRPFSWYLVRSLLEAEARDQFPELANAPSSGHPEMFNSPEVVQLLTAISNLDAAMSAQIQAAMQQGE